MSTLLAAMYEAAAWSPEYSLEEGIERSLLHPDCTPNRALQPRTRSYPDQVRLAPEMAADHKRRTAAEMGSNARAQDIRHVDDLSLWRLCGHTFWDPASQAASNSQT
jgi:hypothetical protein